MSIQFIPKDLWRYGILEYLLGPISSFGKNYYDKSNLRYHSITDIDIVKTVHRICKCVSKSFRESLVNDEEMEEFWLKVSNYFEIALYWKRYDSYYSLGMVRGDMGESQVLDIANLQKLIERTEIGVNSEYRNIVDLSSVWGMYGSTLDFTTMENEYYDWDVEELFEIRLEKLMMNSEKLNRIKERLKLGSYELFLHKALILSLDMVSYFDSERISSYTEFSTFEECQLMSKNLLTSRTALNNKKALGLTVSLSDSKDDLLFSDRFIAMSIEISPNESTKLQIPPSVKFLSIIIGDSYEVGNFEFLDSFFPNVMDLTIKMSQCSNRYDVETQSQMEKKIFDKITKSSFPKLVRLSVKYVALLENVFSLDVIDNLMYLEIITRLPESRWDDTNYFQSGVIHKMIQNNLLNGNSLMHHLITHANMLPRFPDAVYETVEQYYNVTKEHFIASLAHSSINEFYNPSKE